MSIRTSHVEHIDRVRTCYIMYKDYTIGTLTEEYSSLSGESSWVIKPIWENFDKEPNEHGGITGIDEDLRLNEYVRRYEPVFVTQRIPPRNREDINEILKSIKLEEYDTFEVLCRLRGICGNDDVYVARTPDDIVDVNTATPFNCPPSIPDYDTDKYGWL